MIFSKHPAISVVFGRRGSGKSAFIKHALKSTKLKRLIIYDYLHEYGEHGLIIDKYTDFLKYMQTKPQSFRIILRPEQIYGFFPLFCEVVFFIGDCHIIIDEVEYYDCPAELIHLIEYGRHKKISMVMASRRPASVNRLITQSCDFFTVYQTREPRDLVYYGQFFEKNLIEKIKSLPKFHAVSFDYERFYEIDENYKFSEILMENT